jgi:hypothetical protein
MTELRSVILKDPLKLYAMASRRNGNNEFYSVLWQVTISGSSYSLGLSDWDNKESQGYPMMCVDPGPTDSLIYCLTDDYNNSNNKQYIKKVVFSGTWGGYDFDAHAHLKTYGSDKFVDAFYMEMASGNSNFFIGSNPYWGLYNKADGSEVKAKDNTVSGKLVYKAMVVDNLDSTLAYFAGIWNSNTPEVGKIDMDTESLTYQLNRGYGSNTNNILNFGPYQYVVTIPADRLPFC